MSAIKSLFLGLTLSIGAASASLAATISSNTIANSSVYDFSDGPGVFTSGPETRSIGSNGLTFTSTTGSSVFDYLSSYGLSTNGDWDSGRNGYAGLNSASGTMTFVFDQAVSAVGAFINYSPSSLFDDAVLSIFDGGGALLESWNLTQDAPIVTPGALNDGAFRGFERGQADIASFTLSGSYIIVDDLTIGESAIAAVPLPAGAPLLLLALGGMGIAARRRNTQS